ncbi:hypothetical protein IFVP22_C210271 [Vibrio parahaemolyticus]
MRFKYTLYQNKPNPISIQRTTQKEETKQIKAINFNNLINNSS